MKIILFGASVLGQEAADILSEIDGYDVIAFTDNDQNKWGTSFCGFPVISVKEAIKSGADIYITSMYYIQISRQLDSLGFKNYLPNIKTIISDLDNEKRFMIKRKLDRYEEPRTDIFYKLDRDVIKDTGTGRKRYLIVAPGYPSNDNLYNYAFIHRRVILYQKYGLDVEIFHFNNEALNAYVFEGANVYRGDGTSLEYLLTNKKYDKILVHFTREEYAYHINRASRGTPQIIWVIAYETEKWSRRLYNYSENEVSEKRAELDKRDEPKLKFMKSLHVNESIKKIFISNFILKVAEEDCCCKVVNYDIIPNVIDGEMFNYIEKPAEKRKKILVRRPFSNKKYANDLMVKTILELSKKDIFAELVFTIYGDGILFDEVMQPLLEKKFANVNIHRRFLTEQEMPVINEENGIFLCPTRLDSQGVSMGEAMSSGLVAITNNVAAIPEFIDSDSGILCDNENYIQMADAIEYLYNNPEAFLRLSKNAAERIRKQCGIEAVIPREIKLIEE